MRDFADICRESRIKKFLDSQLGTLYMMLDDQSVPVAMVRHFDSQLSPLLVAPFVDLVRASDRWIQLHPKLVRLVEIERPTEVGRDYFVRPFHVYFGSLFAYVDWDDPPDPPEELEVMRGELRNAMRGSVDPRNAIIESVLTRSLLEPTYKTYFDETKHKFVIVEPKLMPEDVRRWSQL